MSRHQRKSRFLVAILLLVLLASGLSGCLFSRRPASRSGSAGPFPGDDRLLAEHVPDQVVVRLKPGADIKTIASSINAQPVKELRVLNAWLLNLPSGQAVGETANRLLSMPGVKYAEPNHVYRPTAFPASGDPSDTYYALQAQALSQIRATDGWSALGASQVGDIAIAVIDTGVDHKHPDFASAGFPGGWKVLPGYNAVEDLQDPVDLGANWYSDPLWSDETHGTHVAGIAAARANDAAGVAGVAWGARILPVKALSSYGGTDFDIARGITWAADYTPPGSQAALSAVKVRVINMSFGGTGYAQVLQDAITYAVDQGVVPVAAMGNEYKGEVSFPAAMQGVIAVGAVDSYDRKANFSNPGSHISLAAPGVDIYSDLYLGSNSHGYGRMTGTSMATPFVSGAAALLVAKWPALASDPALTFAKVKGHLETTARQLSGTTYPNTQTGSGTLDLAAALRTDPGASPGGYGALVVHVTSGASPVYLADVIAVRDYPGASARTVASGRTDVTGTVTFASLSTTPDGSYTIFASTNNGNSGPVPATVSPGATATVQVPLVPTGEDALSVQMSWDDRTTRDLYVSEPGPISFHSTDWPETTNGGFGQFTPSLPDQRGLTYSLKTGHQTGEYTFGAGYVGTTPAAITLTAKRYGLLPNSDASGTQVARLMVLDPPAAGSPNGEPPNASTLLLEWEPGPTVNLYVWEPDGTKTGIGLPLTNPTGTPTIWKSPHGSFTTGGPGSTWVEYRLDDTAPATEDFGPYYRVAVEVQGGPATTTLTLTRRIDPSRTPGEASPRWNYRNLFTLDISK